jgi:hypothetical protein
MENPRKKLFHLRWCTGVGGGQITSASTMDANTFPTTILSFVLDGEIFWLLISDFINFSL